MALVDEINVFDVELSARDRALLQDLMDKRQRYLEQGKGREAIAVGVCLCMVWQRCKYPGIDVQLPGDASTLPPLPPLPEA